MTTFSATAAKYHTASASLPTALAREVRKANQLTIGLIVSGQLRGPRPEKLGVKTSRLRNSIRATDPIINDGSVETSIGTNVVYAGVHEYGFSGTVNVRAHQRKGHKRRIGTTTTKAGKPRNIYRTYSGGMVKPYTRKMNMPARAPIRKGIADGKPLYERAIRNAVASVLP